MGDFLERLGLVEVRGDAAELPREETYCFRVTSSAEVVVLTAVEVAAAAALPAWRNSEVRLEAGMEHLGKTSLPAKCLIKIQE